MPGMSQPTPYTRATAFAEDEASNVGGRSTVRTARVDAELDAVAQTLSETLTNLELIQRDDGKLRDNTVEPHTLSAPVLAMLAAYGAEPRGPWSTATVYGLKNLVTQSGNTYICVLPHTSGVFATDLAAGRWLLFSLGTALGAGAVSFVPTGSISATDVQAAIVESDTENRALSAAALSAATALDSSLRSVADNAKGTGQAGFNPALAYADQTAGAAIRHGALALSQFTGADPTGVADSTAAINAALSAATTLRTRLLVDGRYRHTAQITVPAKAAIVGCGWTSDKSAAGRSQSCFIKDFNGVGFLFPGDDASTDGVQYDSTAAKTGDIIQVTGSRVRLLNGASTNGGNDGVRIGKTEAGASSINANCGVIQNWISLGNARDGINFDHTNTSTSGTFPLGAPDCNAWDVSHVLCGSTGAGNGRDGIRVGNCIDNKFNNIVAQVNTGNAIRFTTSARGHLIVGSYSESNTAGGVLFDSGAKNNVLIGTSMVITGQVTVDNDGSNLIVQQTVNSGINAPFWNFLKIANQAAGGFADVTLHADVNSIDAARVRGSQSSGTRGKLTLQTRTNGNVLTDRLTIDGEVRAVLKNLAEGLLFNKDQADTTTPGVNILGSGGRIDIVNSGSSATTIEAFYNANGQVGRIDTNGSATSYATSSDYRLKRDTEPIDGAAALAAVMSWPIRSFVWKADGRQDVGVIAHELQALKPSAVTGEKDAEDEHGIVPQGVDYSKLVPELVAAVQYLAARLGVV